MKAIIIMMVVVALFALMVLPTHAGLLPMAPWSNHCYRCEINRGMNEAGSSYTPGLRWGPQIAATNNRHYLLGGSGNDYTQTFGDLWEWNVATRQWRWISGASYANPTRSHDAYGVASATNQPGMISRSAMVSDATNTHLWVYGGINSMWLFNTLTGLYTWYGSDAMSNGAYPPTKGVDYANYQYCPPPREWPSLARANQHIYMWGGGARNDLWRWNTDTFSWAWLHGSSEFDAPPVLGRTTQANPANTPGAQTYRGGFVANQAGTTLYLFGGYHQLTIGGPEGSVDRLWSYDIANNEWTWLSGTSGFYTSNAVPQFPATPGLTTFSIGYPGARSSFGMAMDKQDRMWIADGGATANYADIWMYDTNPGQGGWRWVGGSNQVQLPNVDAETGTPGVYATGGSFGYRGTCGAAIDGFDNLMILGGSAHSSVWSVARCPAGTWKTTDYSMSFCAQCAQGSYSADGATACTSCAAGTYQPISGQTSCDVCTGSTTTGATSCNPNPDPDPSQQQCNNPANTYCQSQVITSCGIGSVSPAGTITPDGCSCTPGYYGGPGAGTCQFCPASFYCPGGTGATIIACPDGFVSPQGSNNQYDCRPLRLPVGSPCSVNVDCESDWCNSHTHICVATQCENGEKDGDETDVDCGSFPCPHCALGRNCTIGPDCDWMCTNGKCVGITPNGQPCGNNYDCQSGICHPATHLCSAIAPQPGCTLDSECLSGHCGPSHSCLIDDYGWGCASGADCISGWCVTQGGQCVATHCQDIEIDGDETGIDCGGPTCTDRCNPGVPCLIDSDCGWNNACNTDGVCGIRTGDTGCTQDLNCASGYCLSGTCAVRLWQPGCFNAATCETGFCSSNDGVTFGVCNGDSCTNQIKDGDETDVDCGGSVTCAWSRCTTGQHCLGGADCQSGNCVSTVCT